ncbi:Bromodomain containing protein [Gracilaria domingensis]|nr:Bromodomain containing protein [Gracilaria domingensis]
MHSEIQPMWEDLPASPCSAASDESAMRVTRSSSQPSRPNLLKPRPPSLSLPDLSKAANFSFDQEPSSPTTKRARVDRSHSQSPAGFVEASLQTSLQTADFVAKLNSNADEERRRFLLEKLQAIKSKKAALKAEPSGDDDDVVLVAEKTNPDRKNRKSSVRTARKRKQAPRRRNTTNPRVPSKSPADIPQIINVDDESTSITPAKAHKQPSTTQSIPQPTRQSSRIRRPRASIDEEPTAKTAPLPTCMSKCKRLQFCKKLVNSILREPSSGPFSAPVRELWHEAAIPRYFEVIKQPMDLRTVKKKLNTTDYIEPVKDGILPYRFDAEAFAYDVRLIFRNAMVYNRVGDMLYNCASRLQDDFNSCFSEGLPPPPSAEEISSKLSKKRSNAGRSKRAKHTVEASSKVVDDDVDVICVSASSGEKSKSKSSKSARRKAIAAAREVVMHSDLDAMSRDEMRERLDYLERCRAPVIGRTPVAKGAGYLTRAALLYGEDMTFEEKKRCGTDGLMFHRASCRHCYP